jgi:hypothetical protein
MTIPFSEMAFIYKHEPFIVFLLVSFLVDTIITLIISTKKLDIDSHYYHDQKSYGLILSNILKCFVIYSIFYFLEKPWTIFQALAAEVATIFYLIVVISLVVSFFKFFLKKGTQSGCG